jgi:peptide/nickel transport system substrate-binding protein
MQWLASRRVLAVPLAFGVALSVTALLAVEPAGAAEGPLVVNTSRAPPTLDPVAVCDITDHGFISSLYVALLAYEDKPIDSAPSGIAATQEDTTKFKGDLAKSWNVSADGTKLTFNLTPGVKFPSGRPVDAAAVAASLTRAWKSGKCGTYFFEAAQYGNTQSIEAVDDLTVVITLARAEPLVMHALTQPNLAIVDVKLVEEMGGDEWLASHVAGFGPYLLEDYQPGVRAKFVRNPTYFGKPALEAEVIVNFIADNATPMSRSACKSRRSPV